MSFDNRLFNVNGKGTEMLLKALELVFEQECSHKLACGSWKQTQKHGLILSWYSEEKGFVPLPTKQEAKDVLPIVLNWLSSPFAKQVEKKDWDGQTDHDGSDSAGWRVYVEDWGHVDGCHTAICAVKPVVLWHGK